MLINSPFTLHNRAQNSPSLFTYHLTELFWGPEKLVLNNLKVQSRIERFFCHVTELRSRLNSVLKTVIQFTWMVSDGLI